MKKFLLLWMSLLLGTLSTLAFDQHERMVVGETKTFYFPSEVTSRSGSMYNYNCTSDHINNVEVLSYTTTSVTVKAIAYTASTVHIRFDYWWSENGYNRSDTHMIYIDLSDGSGPDPDPDLDPNNYNFDYGSWGNITVKVGSTKTVYCNYDIPYPDKVKSIVWSSMRNYGYEITTQSQSSCTIKGTFANSGQKLYCLMKYGNSTYKAYYVVNIEAVDPTSITLNSTSVSLVVDGTKQLTATVLPEGASQSVTWSVYSGSDVASVSSSGLVTAKTSGTAIIRATSSVKSSVYKDCTVTVSGSSPTSISLNNTSISLVEGGTEQLTATVLPSDASQSVIWSVNSGSDVASVSSSGLVTAKTAGTAIVRATSSVKSSVYKDCTVTVTEAPLNPGSWSGNTLTIGENATNSTYNLPYSNYYKYSTVQMLYSPTEIGRSGMINGISFKIANTTSFTTSEVKVYLGHKSSKFSSENDFVNSSNLTLVYSGSPTLGQTSGWEKLTFNKGTFTYNGTDNLIIVVTKSATSYTNSLKYYCYSGNGYTLYRRNDNTTGYADVTNTSYSYGVSTERPAIKMDFETAPSPNIQFADAKVKALCIANWDTNGDGELSEAEAAAVTNIYGVFEGNTEITTFNELKYFSGQKSICDEAFYNCSGLTSVIIPNSVTSINNYAFEGCSSLTSVTIPNSVKRIGWCAFSSCYSLTSITIPNSMISIEYGAFSNCSGLTSITIPNSVTSIGSDAFYGCKGLTSVTIPNSVTSIEYGAFRNCSGLTSIRVKEGNTSYDSRNNCNAIIETATNTLIVGCRNTIIPNSVTNIGNYAFFGCSGLTSITIPNSMTSIGNSAFEGCSGLTSITIGNSVTSIGRDAFYGCNNLVSVAIDIPSPLTISSNTFSNRTNCILYVPKGSKNLYETATYWKDFKQIKEYIKYIYDVNGDEVVDVVDVVDIARFIVGTPSEPFDEFLADINNDGTVNIGDAVALVNEIAGQQNFVKAFSLESVDTEDVLTMSERNGCLSLNLENERSYTAFQFDLYVPESADVTQMLLNVERKQQHQLLYNKVEDGHFRVTALSLSNNEFNGNDGELLNIALTGADNSEVSIRNIKFFDVQGQEYLFDDIEGAVATSLKTLSDSPLKGENIYNLAGQRLNKIQRGINIVGGKRILK